MVPVVLLTGFLGSGKTTLLNRLLDAHSPQELEPADSRSEGDSGRRRTGRLAIIVNELGDIGIDGDLLPSGMTRQVELPGGCICCVLNEDLDRTMLELLAGEPDLETIIIETTGVAEPVPISWSLAREPLSSQVRLAAIITVVDGLNHEENRPLSFAVDLQVEYADLLVVSKLDLVAGNSLAPHVMEGIRELNPLAPLVVGTPEENARVLWRSLGDPQVLSQAEAKREARGETHRVDVGAHDHSAIFDTVSLKIEHTLDFEELAALLEELPSNYIRIKGIARVIDESTGSREPHYIAFHRVGTRVSSEPLEHPSAMRLVALGPGIEPAPLAACLDAAVVT